MSNVQSYSVDQYEALLAENKRQADEIAAFNDLQLCDCCEGLFESVTDADGHNQCDTCTQLANLESELTRLMAVKVAICAYPDDPKKGHFWAKAGKKEDGDFCSVCGIRRPAGGISLAAEGRENG